MPPSVLERRLAVVGPGRVGRALLRSWIQAGGREPRVVGRDRDAARRAVSQIPGGVPMGLEEPGASSDCDILVVAVADDDVESVASRLADETICRYAFHVSGVLPLEVLDPLRRSGAALGSLHPLRPFTGEATETWVGAFVAIEAEDQALECASALVGALGAHGHPIPGAARPLYHAGATLCAGGSVALLSLAARAWTAAGISEPEALAALAELSTRALSRAAPLGVAQALTGPIARRDVGTVRAHVEALAPFPDVFRVYADLARETLRRTGGRGREEEIERLLDQPAGSPTR